MWYLLAVELLFRFAPVLMIGLILGWLLSVLILVGANAPGPALVLLVLGGFGVLVLVLGGFGVLLWLVLRDLFSSPYD